MAITGISSSNYNFGSLSSIRKQAQAVADRKEIQRAELRAERERTGLIKNENGEMVPVSSLSEKEISVLEERELKQSTTPQEALLAALATAPNSDEVELNKQMAAKATKMQNKLLQGKRLSGEEIRFLREHFPHLAAIADRMEQEVQQLEKGLHRLWNDVDGKPDIEKTKFNFNNYRQMSYNNSDKNYIKSGQNETFQQDNQLISAWDLNGSFHCCF